MSGAPLPINEAQRLGALYACAILDTGPEREFDALVALEARAQEIFRIGQVLRKRIAEELFKAACAIESLIPEGSTGKGKLREALLSAGDRVAAIGLNDRSLATHLRDFSLLKSGWLATLRSPPSSDFTAQGN